VQRVGLLFGKREFRLYRKWDEKYQTCFLLALGINAAFQDANRCRQAVLYARSSVAYDYIFIGVAYFLLASGPGDKRMGIV